jgi:phage tail sheath protein FI
MAGTYARAELARQPYGVSWPPANLPVVGCTHTEFELNWEEAGIMAEQHINPLVVQPGRGIVAFGARTLSDDRNFNQVNSRRITGMITEQLRRDNEWAVFETNNPNLWDVLERDVMFRLGEFAGAGLLDGKKAGEDYFVQCDAGTNLPALRDAGQVNVHVRMRPVGTVEQIIVDLRIGGDTPGGM